MLKVFVYDRCTTCQKAIKFLEKKGIAFEKKAIEKTPPTLEELKLMLRVSKKPLKSLFNTSGLMYRDLNLKDKLPLLSEKQALELLSTPHHGMLVKRPFLLGSKIGLLGFNEKEWEEALSTYEMHR